MDDTFKTGLSIGLGLGSLLFWFLIVPYFENRIPGEYDFIKGMFLGVFITLITLPVLWIYQNG